jgi:hypothetical protein
VHEWRGFEEERVKNGKAIASPRTGSQTDVRALEAARNLVLAQILTWSLQALRIIMLVVEEELIAWTFRKGTARQEEEKRCKTDIYGEIASLAGKLKSWGYDLGLQGVLNQLHLDLEAFAKRACGGTWQT